MSMTNLSAASPAVSEVWARRTLRSTLRSPFWSRFVGAPGSGMPIIQRFELLNGPGSLLHVPITSSLTGAGVSEETTLAGAEEVLPITSLSTVPVYRRHGVRTNHLAQSRASIDILEEARIHLGQWGAAKADSVRHAAYAATALPAPLGSETYTPNVAYLGGRSSIATVAATDKWTVDEVRKLRLKLIAQNCTPLKSADGADVFGLVITPQQAYDLKSDTAYNTAVQNAGPRDATNPVFSGALAMIDGVAIFSDLGVVTATDGASSAKVARGIAFGAEFAVEGWGENVSFASDQFDYGFEQGTSFAFSFHPRRALPKNSIVVYGASA
jgi:N4-gp56 family major capsid protein